MKGVEKMLKVFKGFFCLQKALQEKDEHIEQLLKERDLERSDVARASVQVDEV